MQTFGTVSKNIPNYLKALKIHLFPTMYLQAAGSSSYCFFKTND